MATSPSSLMFLFLMLPTILVVAFLPEQIASQPLPRPWPCECIQQNETRLHMYLHQFPAWPNVPNPNEVGVISSGQPIGFGQMYVHDWILTMGPNPNETIVGRAQGFHIQDGQNNTSWALHISSYSRMTGSTVEVLGFITPPNSSGEWSIMGGTGKFTDAHGNIKFTVVPTTGPLFTKELDIRVVYTPQKP